MDELRELYQEVILDHSKRPRNFGPLPEAEREAKGHNPLCGDKLTVYLSLDNGTVKNIHFEGAGCAISMASASLMTEMIKGKSAAEARELFMRFHKLLTGNEPVDMDTIADLDKLAAFAGVREFPIRVKCATLAWHTLAAALDEEKKGVEVSTE